MPRASRSGIRGLYVDADGRRRIDLRYTDRDGRPQRHKEVFPPGTPARAAEERAKQILAQALTGTLVKRGEETQPKRLAQALQEYIDRDVTPRLGADATRVRSIHRGHWVKSIGDIPLSELSPEHVATYRVARKHRSPATLNREIATMRHFVGVAESWGWLDAGQAARLRKALHGTREDNSRVRWLSDAERKRLEKALSEKRRAGLRALVDAALWSGCRLGELRKLERARVDFGSGWLTLPARSTKAKRERRIPIGEGLAAVLRAAIARGDAIAKRRGEPKPTHVFISGHGRPYNADSVSGFFARVATEAKIDDFHFHDLRHDFATRLRGAGVGLSTVKELLGHSTITLTERYAHVQSAELRGAIAAIDVAPKSNGPGVAPALPPKRGQRMRSSGNKASAERRR